MQAVPLCSHFTGFFSRVSDFQLLQSNRVGKLPSVVRGKLLVGEEVRAAASKYFVFLDSDQCHSAPLWCSVISAPFTNVLTD